ncbi:hypothetical protein FOCC_FOCC001911 [Frankliniella occidentalis]|nr:hypothetical protein FOCC_FOCC001911 [Frankliniella occidentalis]
MELWCEEHCRVGSADFRTNPCLGRCRGVLNIPTAWSTVCKNLRESAPLQDTILELDTPTNINQDGQKKLLQVFATIRTGVACEIKITSNSQAIGFKWPLEPLHWNNYGTETDTGHHLKLLKLILAASSGTTEFQVDSMELWCEEHCQVGSANFHTNPCLGRCRGVLNIPTAWSTVCKNLRESAPLQDTISELDSQTNINQDGQKKVFAIIRTGVACEIKITSNSQAIRFKWPLEPLHWNNYGSEADTGHHLKLLKLLVAASGSTGFQLGVVPAAQDDGVPTSDRAASQAVHVARDDRKPTPESAQNSTTSRQETEQGSPIKTLLSKVKLRALCRKKPKSCDADDKLKQNVLEALEHTRVVNLEGLSCKEDEEFSLQLLERVRNHPELRSIEVRWPRRQHLEAINKIGQLKKLEIFADAKLRLKSGEVKLAKENGGLKKLKVGMWTGFFPTQLSRLWRPTHTVLNSCTCW